MIQRALSETQGNVTQAARHLGISRKSLQIKMKELKLRGGVASLRAQMPAVAPALGTASWCAAWAVGLCRLRSAAAADCDRASAASCRAALVGLIRRRPKCLDVGMHLTMERSQCLAQLLHVRRVGAAGCQYQRRTWQLITAIQRAQVGGPYRRNRVFVQKHRLGFLHRQKAQRRCYVSHRAHHVARQRKFPFEHEVVEERLRRFSDDANTRPPRLRSGGLRIVGVASSAILVSVPLPAAATATGKILVRFAATYGDSVSTMAIRAASASIASAET